MTDVSDSFAPLPPATKPRGMAIFLAAGVFVGVAALGLGLRGELENRHQNNRREQDRIASDIDGCERSNEALSVARTVAVKLKVYVDGVLSEVENYAQLSEAERAIIDLALEDDRDDLDKAIETIETVDCEAVVPGAT